MRRVLTAAALMPPVIGTVFWAPHWLFLLVLATIACCCYYEYAAMSNQLEPRSAGPIGYAAGLLALAWPGDVWLLFVLYAMIAMTLALRAPDLARALPRSSFAVLGVVYVFGCWKCAAVVRAAGPHWLMFGLLLNWVGDIGAYYVGRTFGKHKLAPRVSPGKSWEGSVGSIGAALLIAAPYLKWAAPDVPLVHVLLLTAVANVAGQIGDLAESAMKRGSGIKDSGTLLPGHGGFLDRVDSTLFALPLIALYLRFAGN